MCLSPLQRLRGLLGREEILAKLALFLSPCSSIHTCFMSADIDVIFFDEDLRVKKLVRYMKPWRFTYCLRAASVLELEQGKIDQLRIDIGDKFSWTS